MGEGGEWYSRACTVVLTVLFVIARIDEIRKVMANISLPGIAPPPWAGYVTQIEEYEE